MLVTIDDALGDLGEGADPITSDLVDMAAFARFAAGLDPAAYVPEAEYIRDADAKPQEKFRVARVPS
jgi:tRNA threonylcarbamoyladenosine biosynthesis protein TsaB